MSVFFDVHEFATAIQAMDCGRMQPKVPVSVAIAFEPPRTLER